MEFHVKYNAEALPLVSKKLAQMTSVISLKGKTIGAKEFSVIAGPCSVESSDQIMAIAKIVSEQGATVLRGGAFKPRTSPYEFQGRGEEALHWLSRAANRYHLLSVSEVMDVESLPLFENTIDILQVGSRNMQNFRLLEAIGHSKKPVILKRGFSATYQEFLSSAEYILKNGNPNVILCERGIRTFENATRNTLDIAAVPMLREMTHLPIIVDPSHGTGVRHAILPMANAALAVLADGVMVEVHMHPEKSLSDSAQTICPEMFSTMMKNLRKIAPALDRQVRQSVAMPV
jgi:3-deoxy-7-phosphoheptulonate synthase